MDGEGKCGRLVNCSIYATLICNSNYVNVCLLMEFYIQASKVYRNGGGLYTA